jgi:hypothetical protein
VVLQAISQNAALLLTNDEYPGRFLEKTRDRRLSPQLIVEEGGELAAVTGANPPEVRLGGQESQDFGAPPKINAPVCCQAG